MPIFKIKANNGEGLVEAPDLQEACKIYISLRPGPGLVSVHINSAEYVGHEIINKTVPEPVRIKNPVLNAESAITEAIRGRCINTGFARDLIAFLPKWSRDRIWPPSYSQDGIIKSIGRTLNKMNIPIAGNAGGGSKFYNFKPLIEAGKAAAHT